MSKILVYRHMKWTGINGLKNKKTEEIQLNLKKHRKIII